MPAAIISGAKGQPGIVAYPDGITSGVFNELNYVVNDYIPGIVAKYGNSSYALVMEILGRSTVEEVSAETGTFSHFEHGRNTGSVLVNAAVIGVAAGAAVTFVCKSTESYNDGATGTQSPLLLGQTVKIRSNGVKAKVTAITRTTSAFSVTVTPLKTTDLFRSGTSGTQLNAGEGIETLGNQLAGEASDSQGTQSVKKYRIDNTATILRASVKSTDLAVMTKSQIGIREDELAIKNMNQQFLLNAEDAFMEGVGSSNISGTVGTVGVLPEVVSRGGEVNYITGSLAVADFHRATAVLDANGGPREYHGLQDLSQRQEFSDELFGLYPNGSISYGSVGFGQEAAASYGFKSFSIDTFDFHFHRYKGFSAQAVFGYTPTQGDYRANFGLFVPQGQIQDAHTGAVRPRMQMVYQQNPDIPKGQKIYSWEVGYTKGTKTTEASNKYEQIAYMGSRAIGAEQFLILKGVAS